STHEALRAEVRRLKEELREANEQIERSRRLAALGEMAAGIAHEVRNPLASIGLYARILEQEMADRPRERETAGEIIASVRGLDGGGRPRERGTAGKVVAGGRGREAVVGEVVACAREMRVGRVRVGASEVIERALAEVQQDVAWEPAGVSVRRLDLERG